MTSCLHRVSVFPLALAGAFVAKAALAQAPATRPVGIDATAADRLRRASFLAVGQQHHLTAQ